MADGGPHAPQPPPVMPPTSPVQLPVPPVQLTVPPADLFLQANSASQYATIKLVAFQTRILR